MTSQNPASPSAFPQNSVGSNHNINTGKATADSTSINSTSNPSSANKSIGDILVAKGAISPDQFKRYKLEALNTNQKVENLLITNRVISEDQYYRAKGELFNIPFVDVTRLSIPVEVLNKFPQEVARKNGAIVFEVGEFGLKVAMTDPLDIQKIKFLSTLTGKRIEPYFATNTAIKNIVDTRYGAQIASEVTQALEDVGEVISISTLNTQELKESDIASAPVARIVNMILEYAIKYKASDVFIEPREQRIVVRYRISGVMSEKLTLPKKLGAPVVSRIKILSNLKIDEHRVPQDGRFQVSLDKNVYDLRISVMPSIYGENVVIRLLERGGALVSMNETGLTGTGLNLFMEAIKKTQGILLLTGPTGSGKTTTLAAALNLLNNPSVNIMTLEDPVEIRIEGITQIQVNPDVGLTFAKGLRSLLRQNPDIIMVGEIRDKETAELAIQASMTGHLVLATLHTNSASGSLPRLIDMGIEPFLLASTINVAAAQRLVRKLCDNCKQSYLASAGEIEKLKEVFANSKNIDFNSLLQKNAGKIVLYKSPGCPQCSGTGYKGRIGIFEVMKITDSLSALILARESASNIEKAAITEGMSIMIQDGFVKVLSGVTTIEEVLRVIN